MEIALWVVSAILAVIYVLAGATKAFRPRAVLIPRMPWASDFSDLTVKLIGIAEMLGALGLVLPRLTGVATELTPLAATGLVIVQVLAIGVHVRRGETGMLPLNVGLLAGALFVAIIRFTQL